MRTVRGIGAPVLEINVADEQIDDLVDDALQVFQERDYDGTTNTFLKYKITQDDIDRGRGRGGSNPKGLVTTTASSTIDGQSVSFSFEENSNYLQVPPEVLGITKIYHFDGSNTTTNNMFSIKYQLFLNDIYYFGSTEILTYAMTKRYLEDIDFALTTQKQIRFNIRQDSFIWTLTGQASVWMIIWSSIAIDCLILMTFQEFTMMVS